MAPPPGTPEALVLDFVKQQNRPVNVQIVVDFMQRHGLKKTAIQKALDSLAVDVTALKAGDGAAGPSSSNADIIFKDYGKQRIYMARQDSLQVLSKEQMEQMRSRMAALLGEAKELRDQCSALERERGALESSLTLPQIQEHIERVSAENAELEAKLHTLRGATGAVSTEERQQVDEKYGKYVGLWRKRKRMFTDLWSTVTENYPRNLKDFKEDLGIDMDEDAGCRLADFEPQGVPRTPLTPRFAMGMKRKGPSTPTAGQMKQVGKMLQMTTPTAAPPKPAGKAQGATGRPGKEPKPAAGKSSAAKGARAKK